MSVNEELEEHVHHAHEPFDKRVAATMAIVAALLAVVSVLGHYLTTEELLLQQQASDQWAFYQAKSIRRYVSETTRDVVTQVKGDPKVTSHYDGESKRYRKEGDEIQDKAKDLEKERDLRHRQALRVDFGEVFLEVAIVFMSLSILSKREQIFYLGMGAAVVGIAGSLTAFAA